MGAQTSKVARKLPTKARPETLQNIPNESPATLGSMANAASGKIPPEKDNLKLNVFIIE
jgi:hypothetical protein